jgi:hypothetical protein
MATDSDNDWHPPVRCFSAGNVLPDDAVSSQLFDDSDALKISVGQPVDGRKE